MQTYFETRWEAYYPAFLRSILGTFRFKEENENEIW